MDDMLVYRMGPSHFMLVVNAANIDQGLRLDQRAGEGRAATWRPSTRAAATR